MNSWQHLVTAFTTTALLAVPVSSIAEGVGLQEGQYRHDSHSQHKHADHKKRHQHRMNKMVEHLSLTESQQAEIKLINGQHREQHQGVRQAVHEARKALRESVRAGESESTIRALATALGQAMGDQAVARASHHQAVSALLTEEQREKWQSLPKRKALDKRAKHPQG